MRSVIRISFAMVVSLALSACTSQVRPMATTRPSDLHRRSIRLQPNSPDLDLDSALKRLTEIVRLIDEGEATLTALGDVCQPNHFMTIIRKRFREDPESEPRLRAYLRSPDELIAARVIAAFALSHLWTESAVRVLDELLIDPPDLKLAGAAIMGYFICQFGEDRPNWGDTYEHLVSLGLPPAYGFDGHQFGGHCSRPPFNNGEDKVRPMLDGLVAFLDRQDAGSLRLPALYVANEYCNRGDASEMNRAKFRKHAEKIYLNGEPGWHIALGNLRNLSRVWSREELIDLLGRGLGNLDPFPLTQVLDEVARDPAASNFKPPFSDHLGRAVEFLARSPKEGGQPEGTYVRLRALLKDAGRLPK